MSRDSTYCYIHAVDPRCILFEELWHRDTIAYDEIDLPAGSGNLTLSSKDNLLQRFLSNQEEPENDLVILNSNNSMFNASYTSRSKQKARNLNWKDLGLTEFLNTKNHVSDESILKKPKFGDVHALDKSFLEDSEDEIAAERIPSDKSPFVVGREDTSVNYSVNQSIGPLSTPVVNDRTISQNLESMNSFSAHPVRYHGHHSAASRNVSSGTQDHSDSEAARMIR